MTLLTWLLLMVPGFIGAMLLCWAVVHGLVAGIALLAELIDPLPDREAEPAGTPEGAGHGG